tara:strand:+ start:5899 stop:6588 length:690 start_codon:yes stop_codon:yes gene_type:complete
MTRSSAFGGASGSTLTVSLQENITIDNRDYGSKQSISFPSITDVHKRIVTATTTEATFANFGAAASAGTFVIGDVRYMRFSNLDDTYHITLTFKNEYDDEVAIKLDKGQTFVWMADMAGGLADVMVANQQELQFTDATCDYTGSSTTATCDASAKIKVGQTVNATNVPDRVITAVNTVGAVTSFTMSGVANDAHTNHSTTFTMGLGDLSSVTAQSDQQPCDMEIYIACV